MRPIKRYEDVELVVPANFVGNNIQFPDIPQLRSDVTKDVIIRGIEIFPIEAVPLTFNGNPTASFAQMQNAFLTLYVEGEESLFRIPLLKLLALRQANVGYFFEGEPAEFENMQVDWTKSYVTLVTPLAGNTQFAFLFGMIYQRLKAGSMNKLRQAAGQSNCAFPGDISMM